MKAKEASVSAGQIAVFLVLFTIGSTPMFELGSEAGQDSWIAIGIAAAAGFCLLLVYRALYNRAPDTNLAGLYKLHFGKLLGGLLGAALAVVFALESMRNVRDFGELISATLLPQTPMWCTMLVLTGIVYYTSKQGVEAFFRVNQVLIPVLAVSYISLLGLFLASGLLDLNRLRPVLEHGFRPVLHAAFPDILSFPFGQVMVLMMFWTYARRSPSTGAMSYGAYAGVSLFLIAVNMVLIMVLGPELYRLAELPTLEAVEQIRLFNFLERLDILVTLLLYIGLYVKATGLFFGSVIALRTAWGVPYRAGALVMAPLIFTASLLEPVLSQHLWTGMTVYLKFSPYYQIALPLLMLVMGIGWVKKKAQRQAGQGGGKAGAGGQAKGRGAGGQSGGGQSGAGKAAGGAGTGRGGQPGNGQEGADDSANKAGGQDGQEGADQGSQAGKDGGRNKARGAPADSGAKKPSSGSESPEAGST
ncbi:MULTISPECIES: endospore germination permease [unclassified Paenibacillus]|uniref:GerAB/ArcD/ProY family transporter n=1 Tax=unclassified Paenibacillus TaxID=185978 RepID=UPI0009543B4B|nr:MULTISPECIES: endospore germination permease [unclassified Paenibacillus]ASS65781.1 endospore germination permease [Paenibacillus sp. RUD330]SIQ23969.1 spore germination protein KB [Paenibacillus sp. RU4X]SIQ45695.1 spore germination protein KB [Paenibacillus sp. RU4T]